MAVGLVSGARESARGVVIPALHDAANDAPIAYTPACGSAAGIAVCLNPAYRRWLPEVTAGLAPVLAEVAQRLASLPTAARHAWLAAHLAALRAGRLTLQDLP